MLKLFTQKSILKALATRGLNLLARRVQHVEAVSLWETSLLKDRETTTRGSRLRWSPNNWPRDHLLRVRCKRLVEHGQRHPGGDQPHAVHCMRPDGVRNVPTISAGPSRTYFSQLPLQTI